MSRNIPRILFVIVGTIFAASLAFLLAHGKTGRSGGGMVGGGGGSSQVMMPSEGPAHSADPLSPDQSVVEGGLSIPPFTLTTSDGRAIGREVFDGHITIVDFFFTRCIFVCPVLTQQMADQAAALRGTGVRLLSVSVDPDHETNESLAAYAKEHNADPARWTFSRGDKATIGAIVQGGLKFAVGEDPKRDIPIENGGTMHNIVHPPWFALIGPKGEVLGIYRATDEEEMKALTERARAAAAKLGK